MNRSINGYLKAGVPLNEENTRNIAVVADYNYYVMDSYFGATKYLAGQHSGFLNLLYQNEINESHKFTAGLSANCDRYDEDFLRYVPGVSAAAVKNGVSTLASAGAFGEYTYHAGDVFSLITGLRGDFYTGHGFRVTPRLTMKYSPVEEIVIRANGGRGLRFASPLVDNIGVLSTGKRFLGDFAGHMLEDAWTFGGNMTYYIPFGPSSDTYLSFDYFRTQFADQMIADYEHVENAIDFYSLDGRSFTDNYQVDFNIVPLERFTVTATFRYTDAKVSLAGKGLVERPMTSRYKGVLNLQYAARLNKWIFDFTASVNGPARVYDFMLGETDADGSPLYRNGLTPVYPLLYFQITKRFKGLDLYIGGENLTGFTQKNIILGSGRDASGHVHASQSSFDASAVWGPVMGAKFYAGVRFTLWKKA